MCVDKTKAVLMQDAFEIIDRQDPHYFDHDLFTPHLIRIPNFQDHPQVMKLVGTIVVPGKHVVKIQLDHKFEALYQEKYQRLLKEKQEGLA